ncbi:hypothetical protein [Kitasatospora purpeofusca]|uniref:hypothetical protein n=1 Tax=Kitasatospora purpeofusca TaxID=67352 RepID=UPI0036B0F815
MTTMPTLLTENALDDAAQAAAMDDTTALLRAAASRHGVAPESLLADLAAEVLGAVHLGYLLAARDGLTGGDRQRAAITTLARSLQEAGQPDLVEPAIRRLWGGWPTRDTAPRRRAAG